MMKDKALEDIFLAQKPHFQDNADFMAALTKRLDAVEYINAKIYANHGQIVVEGADGNTVTLYDVSGRMLATKRDDYLPLRLDVPASGTYMVKIGDYPARRVVVIK